MNDNYSKFLKLLNWSDNTSNKFNKKIIDVDIVHKISEILSFQGISLNKQQRELEKLSENIEKTKEDIEKTESNMIQVRRLFIWFITIFAIVFLGWCMETFFRFANVKQDYIKKTGELNWKIEIFKKEIENIKKLSEEFKNNTKEDINKEVERQLNKKIIEFNFKILNHNDVQNNK